MCLLQGLESCHPLDSLPFTRFTARTWIHEGGLWLWNSQGSFADRTEAGLLARYEWSRQEERWTAIPPPSRE